MNYERQLVHSEKKTPCCCHDSDSQNNFPRGFSSKMCRLGENIDWFS